MQSSWQKQSSLDIIRSSVRLKNSGKAETTNHTNTGAKLSFISFSRYAYIYIQNLFAQMNNLYKNHFCK